LRDRFDSVEGLSGWDKDDTLTGSAFAKGAVAGLGAGPGNPVDESDLKAKNVHLIDGLADLLGLTPAQLAALVAQELAEEAVVPVSATAARSSSVISIAGGDEIILGGGGSDTIKGNLGNDTLDGDAWLNVRIKIVHAGITYSAESMNTSTLISGPNAGKVFNTFADGTPNFNSPAFGGASLTSLMLNRTLNPGDLSIVREILQATTAATDVDTAVYNSIRSDYTIAQNADGTIQVTDNRAVGTLNHDGSDRINHIERLQFADQTLTLFAPVITSNGGGATAAINFAENDITPVTTVLAGAGVSFSLSGTDALRFNINATTGVLSFINAPDFETPTDAGLNNVYDLIVTANNGLLTDTQALAVTVTNVIEAPVITSNGGGATASVNMAENSTLATTVTATAEVLPLVYSISGEDATKFSFDQTTGALSFISAPNFEAPGSATASNVYNVIVQVGEGALIDTQALAVTVTNVNEAATGSLNITGFTTTATAANLTATNTLVDPDGMTSFVQYQWQRLVGATWTNIAGATAATLNNQSNSTIRVTSSYNDPFGANNVISAETTFIGTAANNTRAGTAGNDIILGLGGDDTLTGNAGVDTVDGGIGNDRLVATVNDGNDTYIGGADVDTYDLSGTTANATVNLSAGSASSSQTGADTLTGIENVIGSTGNDTITDGAGANLLDGRAGNDTFVMTADNASDDVRGGTGVDSVDYSALSANLTVTLNGGTAATVNGSGTAGNNDVIASIVNFTGGSGNDAITGDNGANRLNGGAGNDALFGGTGSDNLTGGLGADTFIYTANNQTGVGAATRDVITDFVSGTDKLDFSGIDADTRAAAPGNQAFTFNATAGAAFTGPAQLVFHYEGAGANEITVIQGNVNNNLNPEFEVALLGHITFNAATDIIL
jgi:Ca2+-binding RTX toxin-like protein